MSLVTNVCIFYMYIYTNVLLPTFISFVLNGKKALEWSVKLTPAPVFLFTLCLSLTRKNIFGTFVPRIIFMFQHYIGSCSDFRSSFSGTLDLWLSGNIERDELYGIPERPLHGLNYQIVLRKKKVWHSNNGWFLQFIH